MEMYEDRSAIFQQDGDIVHYGVKGMKWGVRRRARKDAKEFARAKMFYGEGAGTRRKLIKAKVNESSKDPDYKAEFDSALAKQDMRKHAEKAKNERHRKDAVNSAKKTGRGIANIVSGHPERLGAAMMGTYAAYRLMKHTGADKIIAKHAKDLYRKAKDTVETRKARHAVEELFKRGVR